MGEKVEAKEEAAVEPEAAVLEPVSKAAAVGMVAEHAALVVHVAVALVAAASSAFHQAHLGEAAASVEAEKA